MKKFIIALMLFSGVANAWEYNGSVTSTMDVISLSALNDSDWSIKVYIATYESGGEVVGVSFREKGNEELCYKLYDQYEVSVESLDGQKLKMNNTCSMYREVTNSPATKKGEEYISTLLETKKGILTYKGNIFYISTSPLDFYTDLNEEVL